MDSIIDSGAIRSIRQAEITFGLSLVLSSGLFLTLGRSMLRPLGRLTQAMRMMADNFLTGVRSR